MNGVSARLDDAVLRIVLDKPEKRNAVDIPMLRELNAQLAAAGHDGVRVVVLTGAGGSFCSGGDLGGRGSGSEAITLANAAVRAIAELPKPVVAGVQGAATGYGCPLALACDLVVAQRSSFFQLAFTKVGLVLDGGASALIPASIGRARAARMAMLAERITAALAFDWGMISHLVDDDAYDTELASVVHELATGPTLALAWIKRELWATTVPGLPAALTLEADGQTAMSQTADYREGVAAFRQQRRPQFRGQ
jgi:enoyl-CoA hydratase